MRVMMMYIKKITFGEFGSNTENFYIQRIDKPDYESKIHTHDCFQIIYCKHGSITHHLQESSARLLRGDIFIIPPDVMHHVSINEADTIFYNISFKRSIISQEAQTLEMTSKFLDNLQNYKNVIPRFSPMYEDIYLFESAIGKMRIEYGADRPGRQEIIQNCLYTILSLLARMYVKYESDTVSAIDRKRLSINNCISYIDSHYDSSISLEEITKMSAMSTGTFCNLFKEVTGMSFREYMNKKRIERAQSYLRDGEGVSETAYICGFNEISTFYRNFVKITGMMPSEFKKQCEKKEF